MRYRLFTGMSSSPQASLVAASLFICNIQSVSNKIIIFHVLGEVEPILLITYVAFSVLWTNKNINNNGLSSRYLQLYVFLNVCLMGMHLP